MPWIYSGIISVRIKVDKFNGCKSKLIFEDLYKLPIFFDKFRHSSEFILGIILRFRLIL
jgi:hypothetical protein